MTTTPDPNETAVREASTDGSLLEAHVHAVRVDEPTRADPSTPPRRTTRRLHPLPLRIMHWINAVTIILMIGSGWKIYDDEVIFGWLSFPDWLTIGRWAQHGLQVHFFGMWILVINGLAYLTYGFVTGRFRRMLLPIRWNDLVTTVRDALRFKLAHDDPTRYNAIQKMLYIGVIATGLLIVFTGLLLWKPIQFSEVVTLFGGFQNVRLVHFLCMATIVGFLTVHVVLALLVPKTIVAMVGGGPTIDTGRLSPSLEEARGEAVMPAH